MRDAALDFCMSVRAPNHASIQHVGQADVVGVIRRTRNLQRSIDARHPMIEQGVLIVWPPSRTSHVVNFDLYHLFDAIDDARHANLFLFRRRRAWLRLWLLWHLRSPNINCDPVGTDLIQSS
jgi:hypothetical protein